MPTAPFAIDFDEMSSVLRVSGDIDDREAKALHDAIEQRSEGFTRGLTVDLSAVTYLPSGAVGALVKARQQFTAPLSLELVAANGSIAQRVLVVCALPFRAS